MKKKIVLLLLALPCLAPFFVSGKPSRPNDAHQSINAIIGDKSFESLYGCKPLSCLDETFRIQTHLNYVLTILEQKTTSHLSEVQQRNRIHILQLLKRYIHNAQFPVNAAYANERRPCFIDASGNICAVGYLLQETSGRAAAEEINKKHQYDYVMDMHEPALEKWAADNGLTLEECAMIQPTYGPVPSVQTVNYDIKSGYGVSSGIVGGANIALTINALARGGQLQRGYHYVSLVTGAGQVILGLTNIRKSGYSSIDGGNWMTPTYVSYKAQNTLSYVNIAMGSATLISSAINLAMQKKGKDQRHSFNVYGLPNEANQWTMGLSFSKRL
ncbi:MAG: hypothetical protein J0H92_06080 [Sphingobacteriales bacterium]|nr:hypothetical protein [Sphingobacteriales bacterium]OJW30476.1 MAG: hypothetical protein BGO54_21605 [Sphingobacteriales bacterium 46-32]